MSGYRSQYGLARQGMLPYGPWVHPDDGRPTTAYYNFIQTLWNLVGGSNTPVNPASGSAGITALAEDVTELQGEVDGLQGLLYGLGEIPDTIEFPEPDLSAAFWDSIQDTPASQAKPVCVVFKAGGTIGGDTFFTAQSACKIVGVQGRLNTANAGAATLTPAIVPSGTAVTSGTAISSAMNLASTANTVQVLGLTSAVIMGAGDSLGLLSSGTIVAATGSLTIFYVEV
jgi:hypothetical protein